MRIEIIDGYKVTVTDSAEFLTEVEEAALLLLDPSYFGQNPSGKFDVAALKAAAVKSGMSVGEWSHAVPRPSNDLTSAASRLTGHDVARVLNKLAGHWAPGRLVKLRCGEFYSGTALNYYSRLLGSAGVDRSAG